MMPEISIMGQGALETAAGQIKGLGFKKALIVTDKDLVKFGVVKQVTDKLDGVGVGYAIFDGTEPNPSVKNVEDGVAVIQAEKCDFVISIGGGSPHDCAKGIALVNANGGSIKDYEGVNKSAKRQTPLVTINTTAGTASEMTIFCIITDTDRHVKMAIVDKNVNSILAVNDPLLHVGMPPSLTAATGMDALTHAVEAYVSTAATPITDACAVQAISLIHQYLKLAVENGKDLEIRDKMAYAEFLAGMAFNNASLGYVHAMAHQLGGFYNLAHGVCNAILLPHVQDFNKKVAAKRLGELAQYFGLDTKGLTDGQAADMTIKAIRDLSVSINIPSGLGPLGLKEEDFSILADNAMKDACGATNPIQPTKDEVMQIFRNAL